MNPTTPASVISYPWTETIARGRVPIVLIRHGRTAWNRERRFLGTTDAPLDDVGRREAETLGTTLAGCFDQVYSSPLARAWETARRLSVRPIRLDAVRELEQGHLEGLLADEAIEQYPEFFARWSDDPTEACAPGGESLGACRDRALSAIRAIAQKATSTLPIAVVTHQMVIASVGCTVDGKSLKRWRAYRVGNAALMVLEWDGNALAIERPKSTL